jgi:hypothetical protein
MVGMVKPPQQAANKGVRASRAQPETANQQTSRALLYTFNDF